MATDSPPIFKWSSRERSVPEVSLISDSSLKCQSNNFGFMPTFDPLIRKDFPLCSSPPHKAAHAFNNTPQFIPSLHPQWTPEPTKAPNLDAFKNEILSAILCQHKNQYDSFKSDILSVVRKEQKAEIDELKKGVALIKNELSNLLPNIKNELLCMLEMLKIDKQRTTIQKNEIGLQVAFEKQDQSVQTDDVLFKAGNPQSTTIEDENEMFRRQEKPHEGFELRLVKDYEKQSYTDGNSQKVFESDHSESDEVDEDFSPVKRPMKRLGPKYSPDCDMVLGDDRYTQQGPNQRGGFARVQELRMTGASRNPNCVIPGESSPCNEISIATNAVLAKYLPADKVAECQTPRRQNQPPAQDVVFNMTNVSFAMRYPAENDTPDVGNYNYPPQNRHLKPNRFHEDRYESEDYWESRNPRRIVEEDEWQTQPPREMLRRHHVPERDRLHHGMTQDNGMEQGYHDYNYGRRDGFVRDKWGRPCRENFHGRRSEPDWENGNNYPIRGRGQPPINNRILDITAIKNQPKLT